MEFTKLCANGSNKENTVESSYSQSDLLTKTIIRDEINNHYFVFNTQSLFEKWYLAKEVKNCHEVIFGKNKQRIKFDIDIINPVLTHNNVYKILNIIIKTIIDTINTMYRIIDNIVISNKDLIVTESSGITDKGYKYSFHIIIFTYAVYNNNEVKNITESVINNLPNEYKSYIDKNTSKSIQNFRLLHSTKINSDRCKKVCDKFNTHTNVTLLDTLIIPFDGIKTLTCLCDDSEEDVENITNVTDEFVDKIIKTVRPYNILDGHEFRNKQNNSINFDRIIPTFCRLCNEIHHNDNSLVINFDTDTGNIYEYCRQGNSSKIICNINSTLNIDDIIKVSKNITEDNKFYNLPNKNIYSSDVMKEFELVSTLVVKAQMKMGKTKMLKKYINDNFNNSTIRFVSFRQTFSNHIYNLFNDFEIYSNIKGTISTNDYKKVIIQVESLHRLHLDNDIDLLVLDEVESIIGQLSSGLHKNFNASFAMFLWLLSSSKYVICLDANISNRTYNILQRFRKQEIFYHCNTWKTSKNDTYYITNNENIWLSQLITKIEENKKIAIPTNSITEAKTCKLLINNKFPNLSVRIYSSEMKNSEKQKHFTNVHKYWSELDILIYTPTCSAGISYELDHFDYIFGCFYNTSCDVETCRQMIGRIRNVKSGEFYLCLKEITKPKLPETTEDLHNYLYNKRLHLCNYINDPKILWSYNDNSTIKFYDTDYYHIWLENTIISNISKNDFIKIFCDQIKISGAKLINMEYINTISAQEHCDLKKAVKKEQYDFISNSEEINDEIANSIINKLSQQSDVEYNEYLSYEKYKLRKVYNFDSTISPEFVESYKSEHVQQIYKNLCDISQCNTIEESLNNIMKKEYDRYSYITSSNSSYKNKVEQYDLHNENKLYNYLTHLLISKFIVVLGTNNLTLDEYTNILTEHIEPIINHHESYLSNELKVIIGVDKKKTLNNLLKHMYGLRVYKKANIYRLRKCDGVGTLFTFTSLPIPNKVTIVTTNELFLSLK